MLLVLVCLLTVMFRRLMMADGATGRRSKDAVVSGHMTGDTANRSTLQATLCLHRRDGSGNSQHTENRSYCHGSHRESPHHHVELTRMRQQREAAKRGSANRVHASERRVRIQAASG
jgi:hypothetical protein